MLQGLHCHGDKDKYMVNTMYKNTKSYGASKLLSFWQNTMFSDPSIHLYLYLDHYNYSR